MIFNGKYYNNVKLKSIYEIRSINGVTIVSGYPHVSCSH